MNVAKWLLLTLLALPLAELAVFIAVATAIGFVWTLGLLLASSLVGALVLRHAGGNHIARVRMAMSQGLGQSGFTALQTDGTGGLVLLGGILLLIPGFITDFVGLSMLVVPLWRALNVALGRKAAAGRTEGVIDLEPEQWRRVDDPVLPGRRNDPDNHTQNR